MNNDEANPSSTDPDLSIKLDLRKDRFSQKFALVLTASALTIGTIAVLMVKSYTDWIWTVVVFGVAGGACLVCLSFMHQIKTKEKRGWIVAGFSLAVAIRIILIAFPSHELSDDIYRYHWDGKVLVHGINPYMYSPDAPHLTTLRDDEIDGKVNHPYNLTCYPPAAQLLFALGYILSPNSLVGLNILFLLSEIVAWLILLKLLERKKKPGHLIMLVAFMPLGFIESYLPGHIDPLALPWLAAFLMFLDRKQAIAAALALAVAVQFRPLFILFAPVAALQFPVGKSLKAVAAFMIMSAMFYLPFLSAGQQLFSSTWLMIKYWKFNSSISWLISLFLPDDAVRIVGAVSVSSITLFSAWWLRKKPVVAMQAAIMAFVAFSPTVFAWYLIGALVLVCLEREAALLSLLVLLPLSELVMIPFTTHGLWQLPIWARLMQYVPFYAILAWEMSKRKGVFNTEARSTNA